MTSDLTKSVSKTLVILSVTRVITWSSTFVLMLFLPRYLGPLEYGRFYLGLSVVSIFALVIEFGGNYSITKAIARHPDRVGNILVDSVAIRIVLWLFSFATIIGFALFSGYHSTVQIVIIIFGISMLWGGARSVLFSCYRGLELIQYPSYGAIAETLFIATVGIAAVTMGKGAIWFAVITAAGSFINFLICVKYIPTMTASLARVQWKQAFVFLKDGFPYFLNSIFGVIYYRIDTIMLSYMAPERVVGWYGASYKFFDALMFIPSIFTIAVFPGLSRIWGEGKLSLGRPLKKSLDLILLAGVPVSILAFMFSREIIDMFYGLEGYRDSVILLKIFSAGLLLVYIDMMLGIVLLAADRQKVITRISFWAIFVNIGLNVIFIPYSQELTGNGGIGSGIATLCTELFVMVMMIRAMPAEIIADCTVSVQLKTLGCGILMAIVLWFMRSVHCPWIIQTLTGVAAYAIGLLALKVLEPTDISFLRTVQRSIIERLFKKQ